jgi:regulator of RNase E activity RraB
MPYVLHILTHGRRYTEDYDSLEEALEAAFALEHEPRERAEFISRDGQVCCDRESIEALAARRSS